MQLLCGVIVIQAVDLKSFLKLFYVAFGCKMHSNHTVNPAPCCQFCSKRIHSLTVLDF